MEKKGERLKSHQAFLSFFVFCEGRRINRTEHDGTADSSRQCSKKSSHQLTLTQTVFKYTFSSIIKYYLFLGPVYAITQREVVGLLCGILQ